MAQRRQASRPAPDLAGCQGALSPEFPAFRASDNDGRTKLLHRNPNGKWKVFSWSWSHRFPKSFAQGWSHLHGRARIRIQVLHDASAHRAIIVLSLSAQISVG